mgnify:FL=1|jgi:hypothetical protein
MDRNMSFDVFDRIPEKMRAYLSNYGFNFSKKMCDWAVSMMETKEGKITPIPKEKVDELLKKYSITLKNDNGYNAVYVANMCKADYFGSSIPNEQYLAMFVRDFIDDPDGGSEKAFRHFFADCMGKGIVINWDDML